MFLVWALISALASDRFWAGMMGEPTNMLGWFLLLAATAMVLVGSNNGAALRRHLESWVWLVVLARTPLGHLGQLTATDQSAGTFFNSTYLGEGLLLLLPWCLPGPETPGADGIRYATIAFACRRSRSQARVHRLLLLVSVVWAVARRLHVPPAYKLVALSGLSLIALGSLIAMRRSSSTTQERRSSAGALSCGFRRRTRRSPSSPGGIGTEWLRYGQGGYGRARECGRCGRARDVDPRCLLVWVAVSTGVIGLTLFAWAARVGPHLHSRAHGGIDIAARCGGSASASLWV